jgi:hypothetical protein
MQTVHDTYATAASHGATRPDAHPSVRRAVAWAVRIGLLAILFVIPLAAYL